VWAAAYDRVIAPLERRVLDGHRARLLGTARGLVLEVGAGTGANLPHYPVDGQVQRVDLLEPDPGMRRRLEGRIPACPAPVVVHAAGVEGPFPEATYDTIVCTLVLCTVPDPVAAMARLRDALAPDGHLLVIEHVRAPGLLGRLQHRLTPAWQRVAGGCHLDRDTTFVLRGAGLVSISQDVITAPWWSGPVHHVVVADAIHRVRT